MTDLNPSRRTPNRSALRNVKLPGSGALLGAATCFAFTASMVFSTPALSQITRSSFTELESLSSNNRKFSTAHLNRLLPRQLRVTDLKKQRKAAHRLECEERFLDQVDHLVRQTLATLVVEGVAPKTAFMVASKESDFGAGWYVTPLVRAINPTLAVDVTLRSTAHQMIQAGLALSVAHNLSRRQLDVLQTSADLVCAGTTLDNTPQPSSVAGAAPAGEMGEVADGVAPGVKGGTPGDAKTGDLKAITASDSATPNKTPSTRGSKSAPLALADGQPERK